MIRASDLKASAALCAALVFIATGDCRMVRAQDGETARSIAPTGVLRAAINYGNIVLAQRGPDGEPAGISADLARELGRRLDVPVSFTTYDTAGKVVDALAGPATWDVAFLAIDPKRAQTIAFTPPYVVIEGAYMVPRESPLRENAEVDRPGVRIAVGRNTAYDLYLERALTSAERVFAPTSQAALDLFRRDRLDVVASVRQPLEIYARDHADVRVLPGRFMVIEQAVAVPRGRDRASAYLDRFIEEMKASGFVADALARSGQRDATVAPRSERP